MDINEYLEWLNDAKRDILHKEKFEHLIANNRLHNAGINRQNNKKWIYKVNNEIERIYNTLEI